MVGRDILAQKFVLIAFESAWISSKLRPTQLDQLLHHRDFVTGTEWPYFLCLHKHFLACFELLDVVSVGVESDTKDGYSGRRNLC